MRNSQPGKELSIKLMCGYQKIFPINEECLIFNLIVKANIKRLLTAHIWTNSLAAMLLTKFGYWVSAEFANYLILIP